MSDASRRIRLLALPALAATTLVLAATVAAEPVTGGKTVLVPNQETFEALSDMGIEIATTGGAKFGGKGAKFTVTGGIVGEAGKDTIEHKGGLLFSRDEGGAVKVANFTAVLGEQKGKLFAKSNGAQLAFLKLDLSGAEQSGVPGSISIEGAEASLTKQSGAVFTDAFDAEFRRGVPVGELNIEAQFG